MLRSWDCKSLTVLGLAQSSSVCGPGFKQPGLNSKMCQEPARYNPWETQVSQTSPKSYYSALMSHDNLGVPEAAPEHLICPISVLHLLFI